MHDVRVTLRMDVDGSTPPVHRHSNNNNNCSRSFFSVEVNADDGVVRPARSMRDEQCGAIKALLRDAFNK